MRIPTLVFSCAELAADRGYLVLRVDWHTIYITMVIHQGTLFRRANVVKSLLASGSLFPGSRPNLLLPLHVHFCGVLYKVLLTAATYE